MGTLGVHIKGVLPWLVRWARGTIDFCPASVAVVSPVKNIIFLTTPLISPQRPATWAGRRAGLPVSKNVSLVLNISGRRLKMFYKIYTTSFFNEGEEF